MFPAGPLRARPLWAPLRAMLSEAPSSNGSTAWAAMRPEAISVACRRPKACLSLDGLRLLRVSGDRRLPRRAFGGPCGATRALAAAARGKGAAPRQGGHGVGHVAAAYSMAEPAVAGHGASEARREAVEVAKKWGFHEISIDFAGFSMDFGPFPLVASLAYSV